MVQKPNRLVNFITSERSQKLWGILTWPNQDVQMNMTGICEHDPKINNNEH